MTRRARFPLLLRGALDSPDVKTLQWACGGRAVQVDKSDMVLLHEELKMWFNISSYATFHRQLNIWSFVSCGSNTGLFVRRRFVRDRPGPLVERRDAIPRDQEYAWRVVSGEPDSDSDSDSSTEAKSDSAAAILAKALAGPVTRALETTLAAAVQGAIEGALQGIAED